MTPGKLNDIQVDYENVVIPIKSGEILVGEISALDNVFRFDPSPNWLFYSDHLKYIANKLDELNGVEAKTQ